MISIFNRFIDWFTTREDAPLALEQNPLELIKRVGDVTLLVAQPDGKFANEELKTALLQYLVTQLNERAGLSVRAVPKTFKRTTKGSLREQYNSVITEGRALLKEEQADLLLWGKVEPENQSVRWYFLPALEGEANLGVPGFAESLLIPFEPEKPSLDVLYAAVFAACTPIHPSQALKIGEHLLSAIDPLTKLPSGLTPRKTPPAAKTSTMAMCAIVLANIARRGEELGWFEQALQAFKSWEEIVEKEKSPQEWALVANHYGWLYEEMATHENDEGAIEHIEKAISLFEQVCAIFTQKSFPLEWAAVQLRIAGTCARIGRSMGEADYLQKAARYYKKSLDVHTLQNYPLNWADNMTKMARALMLHGQLVKGAQSLEQAGVAFQAVLKVYTQEKYPALWASTHNNLGATLFALTKRDNTTVVWIEHALGCFEEARNYYAQTNQNKMVHIIDKNIMRAEALKEQIEDEIESDLLN